AGAGRARAAPPPPPGGSRGRARVPARGPDGGARAPRQGATLLRRLPRLAGCQRLGQPPRRPPRRARRHGRLPGRGRERGGRGRGAGRARLRGRAGALAAGHGEPRAHGRPRGRPGRDRPRGGAGRAWFVEQDRRPHATDGAAGGGRLAPARRMTPPVDPSSGREYGLGQRPITPSGGTAMLCALRAQSMLLGGALLLAACGGDVDWSAPENLLMYEKTTDRDGFVELDYRSLIDAPCQRVYEALVDVEHYPDFIPGVD